MALAFVVPRSAQPPEIKAAAARRFSRVALWSVVVVAVTGVVRALSELHSVSQLWTTGYGRAIMVKSILFGLLVLLGWVSRARIAAAFTRLRATLIAEVAVFLGVVVGVAFLTALPPGRHAQATAQAATPPAQPGHPPADATVLAQQDGKIAATIAVRPSGEAIAGFIGTKGVPTNVGIVRINRARTVSCGVGCYRGTAHGRYVTVTHGQSKLLFDLGLRKPATGLVARATRAYKALRTARYSETLSAGYGKVLHTVWTEIAPDKLSYVIAGGAKGIVVGTKRWDMVPPATTWTESETVVLPMPTPSWGSGTVTNAHLLRTTRKTLVVSFLDQRSPAWFTVTFDRATLYPRVLEMIAPVHFMHQVYTSFNGPLTIEPPQ